MAEDNKNALLYAVWRTFACDIFIQFFLGTMSAVLSFASPFLILFLTAFIKDGDEDPELTWDNVKPGVIWAGLLIGTQLAGYLISEHQSYFNVVTGRRSSNALIAMVYQKYSKISNATNKAFSSG